MNTTAFVRRLLAFVAAAVLAGAALAGQNCEPRRPTLDTMRRDLALAASVATQLDEMAQRDGSRVLLIARAGQDLSKYGLRYSHLGIAYRDEAALGGRGAWRVVHKLNQCGSSRSELYRQGLAEFFGDGLYLHEAGVVALKPELAARVIDGLKDDVLLVHRADDAPLEKDHGGPVRMITPQLYAWKGAKWIKRLELMTEDKLGFWEERGYSNTAYPWRNDRYS